MPPLIWKRAIFMWPAGAIFLCAPFVGMLPLSPDNRLSVLAVISVVGIILAIVMAIWTPRWAKPKWQRYLEDHYSPEEIHFFIPVWRNMNPQEWSKLLDSEEGIEELVAITRSA
jgi:hypothetical protein